MNLKPFIFIIGTAAALAVATAGRSEDANAAAEEAYRRGQFGAALEQWERALPDLKSGARLTTLLRMAATYQAIGQVSRAYPLLNEAMALADAAEEPELRAAVLGRLSDAYLVSRRVVEARAHALQGVAAARASASPEVLAVALNYLGNALAAQDRPGEALGAYTEGAGLAEDVPALAATISINMAHAHLAKGDRLAAANGVKRALKRLRPLLDSHDKAYDLIAVGYLADQVAQSESRIRNPLTKIAYEALSLARSVAETIADTRARSYAEGQLAELYLGRGRYADAESLLRRAIFWGEHSQSPELLARWYWQLGRRYQADKNWEAAEGALRSALAQLALVQSALVYGERGKPTAFRETIGAIYLDLADLLLNKANKAPDETVRLSELQAARKIMEQFKKIELRNHFRDECVTEHLSRHSFRTLDDMVGSRTAVLYPIVFAERVVLLVSLADGEMHNFETRVLAPAVRKTALAFGEQLSPSGNPRRLRRLGSILYDWLIRPAEDRLRERDIDTLVVVPDYALGTVPFAALYDGRDFLIRRYAIALTPGLGLTPSEPLQRQERRLLLGGLTQAVDSFDALPHVQREIQRTQALYPSTTLLDADFTTQRLQDQLERESYGAMLLASHGSFVGDPSASFLLAYDEKIELDQLERLLRIGQFREKPLDLLVLSSCHSAAGDERAALGFAGVAVKAGASAVVASLWAVHDESTALLVPEFFARLKSGSLSKAKALQQAQLRLLDDPQYAHPFHWAPFVLVGSWF